MNHNGVIYKATCKVSGKSYIGWTNNFKRRKKTHEIDALKGNEALPKFYRAIRKYGIENFEWKIIDWSSSEEFGKRQEIYWIGRFNTFENGYNSTIGGDGGPVLKGKDNPRFGKPMSSEAKKKSSESHKRENLSDETRLRLSVGHKKENLSEITRKKLSEGHKKKWKDPIFRANQSEGLRMYWKRRHQLEEVSHV